MIENNLSKAPKTATKEKTLQRKWVNGLLHWHQTDNRRHMPWKGEKDPYKIWLSEIILQQTRVEQGLPYYQRFIAAFPTVFDLANAPEQQVFKLWEGLGYYTRCRNLIATAQYITTQLNGVFPNTYDAIVTLKGIGPYTAAAIASFAYNLPYAVVDGNVFRVLSRIYDIDTPIDMPEGKKQFAVLAQQILPKKQSAAYNQAIMDFGATVCKPVPECAHCFFNQYCGAYLHGKQQNLPVKAKRTKVKERWFNYIVLNYQNQYAVHQRTEKDIWQNLYEFLLLETEAEVSEPALLSLLKKQYGLLKKDCSSIQYQTDVVQRLSHQLIHFSFTHITLKTYRDIPGFEWISKNRLAEFAFPKTLHHYVQKHLLK